MTVVENLREVREKIAGACRSAGREPNEVLLIAVSKLQPDDRVQAAFAAGQRDFGENYVQELVKKKAMLPGARWHAIGHIQRNKAKGALEADVIHTLDSERLADALEKSASRTIDCLIEVHQGSEETKSGVPESEVVPLIEALRSRSHLAIVGLMCIPPPDEGRRWFAQLRELRDRAARETGLSLPQLSMGMSADYLDAIAEGSTMVRVGTAIFGERTR